MTTISLSATPMENGYQATVEFLDCVAVSSAEIYPSISAALTAAAIKLLDMPERLADLDRSPKWLPTETVKIAGISPTSIAGQ